ncbi:protein kinase [Streptomyces sp. SID1034]|nr:protein kinase [Streptomyces sp. SID1034]
MHRDLKPANLMLTADGKVKVLDFGIARFMAATDKSSQVMGTLAYMAPQRFAEHSGDARSDLYAFGCVLHELLTGEPPFTASDPVSLMTAHLNKAPDRPGSLRAGLPAALDALVLRLLAKRPADGRWRCLPLPSRPRPRPTRPPMRRAPPNSRLQRTSCRHGRRLRSSPGAHRIQQTEPRPSCRPLPWLSGVAGPWLGLGGAALLAGGTGLTLAVRAGGDGGAGEAKASPKRKVRPWRYDSGMSQGTPAPFAVADGVLYVATDATITALDARTGSKRWDGPPTSPPNRPRPPTERCTRAAPTACGRWTPRARRSDRSPPGSWSTAGPPWPAEPSTSRAGTSTCMPCTRMRGGRSGAIRWEATPPALQPWPTAPCTSAATRRTAPSTH